MDDFMHEGKSTHRPLSPEQCIGAYFQKLGKRIHIRFLNRIPHSFLRTLQFADPLPELGSEVIRHNLTL